MSSVDPEFGTRRLDRLAFDDLPNVVGHRPRASNIEVGGTLRLAPRLGEDDAHGWLHRRASPGTRLARSAEWLLPWCAVRDRAAPLAPGQNRKDREGAVRSASRLHLLVSHQGRGQGAERRRAGRGFLRSRAGATGGDKDTRDPNGCCKKRPHPELYTTLGRFLSQNSTRCAARRTLAWPSVPE